MYNDNIVHLRCIAVIAIIVEHFVPRHILEILLSINKSVLFINCVNDVSGKILKLLFYFHFDERYKCSDWNNLLLS